MSDTQWPRFEVFKQDRPGQPHRNVGTVHAPDAEMALMNARDVFARRPACHSLWVVPAGALFSQTAEELATGRQASETTDTGETARYAVFSKPSHRPGMTYVDYAGEVEAASPDLALQKGRHDLDIEASVAWWVCPVAAIARSEPEAAEGYAVATGKKFRMPNQYHTVFTMQKIRRGEGQEHDEA